MWIATRSSYAVSGRLHLARVLHAERFVELVISITRDFVDLGHIVVIHWRPKKEGTMVTLSLIAVVGTFFLLAACALSGPAAISR